MKAIKLTAITLALITILLSPIIIVFSVIALTPKTFSNTIYGELDDKFERLTSTKEDKVIVIGGSSVAFGLDSQLLSSFVGMPVVNFGLYASIGTRAMLDLSLAGVSEGDVVVIAPELDEQTLSMYFSAEHILPAIDENYLMAAYLKGDSLPALLGGSFAFAQRKLSYKGEIPDPEGIYNVKSFNDYGDIKKELRSYNVMQLYYDPAKTVNMSDRIFDPEFIDYLNEYASICSRRGARVYFSYCPINEAAITDDSDEKRSSVEKYLEDNLNFEVISELDNYCYDKAYFYDTNFHLNDTGVELRTKKLAQDVLVALGKFTLVNTDVPPPPLPEADVRYFGEKDENSDDFIYEKMANGAYMIIGLTEQGKLKETLTVPLGYGDYKVTAIGERAFAEGVATKVIVTEDTNLRSFFNDCTADSNVTDIYLYYDFDSAEDKLAPAKCLKEIRVHVKIDAAYHHDYDWSGYNFVLDIE